ncbi:uncharacterized protein LOC128228116 [Mya arenaria]|uniref:uncharacterized protein LOC128228116 n=1 Tax=Mya arenaria TaxID=6604 RepID=UPI0022E6548A|nr:uncharacterized protein LOC128228116 [Mya arenaria]
MKKHEDENNHHCPECLRVFTRRDALDEHFMQHESQSGGGRKRTRDDGADTNASHKKQKLTAKDDAKEYYRMDKISEKRIEKFNSTVSYYKISIKDMEISELPNIIKTVKQIFQSINDSIAGKEWTMDNPQLDFSIVLSFMRRSELTVDRLMSEIERVLQEQFVLNETFGLELVHVHLPTGSGTHGRPYVDISKMLKNKGNNTKEVPGIDPFEKCLTIASACNLVFRRIFLEHENIGIIPTHGYRPEEKQSVLAYKWLAYLAYQKDVYIQHGRNVGEKQIGPYKGNGHYKTEEGEKVALEMNGCFWHGCNRCFKSNTINPVNDMTMGYLYARTLDRQQNIESLGYTYVSKWECDFKKEIQDTPGFQEFIRSVNIVTPLEPRDAFYGGRTEGFKLYEEASNDQEINYYDVTSLYPYFNKTGKIPLGHPEIIIENFKDITKYKSLVKCKIVPPRGLYLPVLPVKLNGKMLFSLCRSCADQYQQSPCQHTDNEKAFLGTWNTDEVKLALSQGYKIMEIYEVWHFPKISQYDQNSKCGGIFTEYVNTFLKVKQEASGWPEWCKTEDDKQSYMQNIYDKEGILLDYDRICKNPGLRSLAKLMLNSFWGKFGQRTNLEQTSYVTDTNEFSDFMTSDQQEIKNIRFVNEETVQLAWPYNGDFIEASSRTNVVIAAYTTAQARIKLYSYLQHLGRCALYCDTDSIIFSSRPGQWKPPLGDYLWDMTDEVSGNKITNFVTGGPKKYAYKTQRCDKNGYKSVCKVKGITLNFKNSLKINYAMVVDMLRGSSIGLGNGLNCRPPTNQSLYRLSEYTDPTDIIYSYRQKIVQKFQIQENANEVDGKIAPMRDAVQALD